MEGIQEPNKDSRGSNILRFDASKARVSNALQQPSSEGISAVIIDIQDRLRGGISDNAPSSIESDTQQLAIKEATDKLKMWEMYVEKYNVLIRAISVKEKWSELPSQAHRDIQVLLNWIESIWNFSTTTQSQRDTLYANALFLQARIQEMKDADSQ